MENDRSRVVALQADVQLSSAEDLTADVPVTVSVSAAVSIGGAFRGQVVIGDRGIGPDRAVE